MVTFCPLCGSANSYSLEKPKTCAKCGKPFASAFKTSASVSTSYPKPTRKEYDSSELSEEMDENEKRILKAEIMASLRGGIHVEAAPSNSVKIEDLFKNPDLTSGFQRVTSVPLTDEQRKEVDGK